MYPSLFILRISVKLFCFLYVSVCLFIYLVFISIYSVMILSFKSNSILWFILHDPLLPSLPWCPFFSQIITLLLTGLFLKSRFWLREKTCDVLAWCNLFYLAWWASSHCTHFPTNDIKSLSTNDIISLQSEHMPGILNHSSTDGHLDNFLNLAVEDSALVNMDIQGSFW